MDLENVFDMREFTEREIEHLKHELVTIKRANCDKAIIKGIEEIKSIPPEKEFYVCGAANCSFLLYALCVTKVDPIRFDLPFERFINPLREAADPIIRTEFAPNKHIQTNLTIEDVIASQVRSEHLGTSFIPISEYKNQPLYDILYETHGNLL